jgi:acetyl-CoA acetyltransferase
LVCLFIYLSSFLGLKPLGRFDGFAVGGCSPEEMGIGPSIAVCVCVCARARA